MNSRDWTVSSAAKKVVERLEAEGLLEKIEEHQHSVGHCYRCHTIIEPYVSTQWFVRMKPLAEPALAAVRDGRVKFHPERWTKIYFDWLENIRDWCISRQIWWGHQIPVWYCACGETIVSESDPERCPKCGSSEIKQDPDVLDTWFSSQLWPFSTLGWPEQTEDLKRFYPTSVLSTAPEIIFFWVARMIMSGLEFMGDVPFRDVYLHGTVRDESGRKMSKSLGNAVDPLEVIGEFGADAMRFTLVSIAATGTDLYLSTEKFHLGRNFANKLWNASRFVLMNFPEDFNPVGGGKFEARQDELAEKWILSRLQRCAAEVTEALDSFRMNDAASAIYNFLWRDYCDWYIELSKNRLYGGGAEADRARTVLWTVLESALRLLHPFMPFITEEIWQRLPHEGESIFNSHWVEPDQSLLDPEAEREMQLIQDIVVAVRNIRGEMNVPPAKKADLLVATAENRVRESIERHAGIIRRMATLEGIDFTADDTRPAASAVAVIGSTELFVPLSELIDLDREREKLGKEASRVEGLLSGVEKKLANQDFVSRAPADVIEKERRKLENYREMLQRLEKNLAQLAE